MSGISTHVLDTELGRPAVGVPVVLERADGLHWLTCCSAVTDGFGRCGSLLALEKVQAGRYRLTFEVAAYFAAGARRSLFPEIGITFTVAEGERDYHVPLLLSAFGYSTYRGS
jgi:5-hydroxyisourate hydrolase